MDPGTIAVIGLCAFLALWYGVAHLYNRYRGQQIFRWLKAGLDVLGGEVEAGWIGSPASGARINVTHAKPPFRRLEITLLLENREGIRSGVAVQGFYSAAMALPGSKEDAFRPRFAASQASVR
ncbi:MAG: hypothetical protein ACYTG0_33610, partial [Planctomycetota bacterium]